MDVRIFEKKEDCQKLIIQSGFIRSFAVDPSGNDISTNFYSVGDIVIDWPSFFLRNPTKENIQALSDCVCWQIDYDSFQMLFNNIEAFRTLSEEMFLGKRTYGRLFIGRLFGKMALTGILKNEDPMKKNQPTHPEFKIKCSGDFEMERSKWVKLLMEYQNYPIHGYIQ